MLVLDLVHVFPIQLIGQACMGSRNLLQMAEFDGFSQNCKTGIQQQQASAAGFGKIPAEMSMRVLAAEIEVNEFGQQ